MEKIFEMKEYMRQFYAKYSRYIDYVLRFILALLTFVFIGNHIGFLQILASPAVILGLSLICIFLPMTMTSVLAAVVVLIQFYTLAPGVAVVSGMILIVMFALYFRFAPGKAVITLLTPIACSLQIPVAIPVVFGLVGNPASVIPMTFGIVVYYMIVYVKSYATVIETVAETGAMNQITNFAKQLFSNKEMWLILVSFTICLLLVYTIKKMSVDYAWKIAVVAGVLINVIMMTFGHVMMDIKVEYVPLIIGSILSVFIAFVLEFFVFSVDYSRTEYLQFEDDEYYYYVKAVPKVSVTMREKTVKKINVRQDTGVIAAKDAEKQTIPPTIEATEERRRRAELEESEIQKIIEEELNS